jgi:hypothetical protein
MDTTSVMLGDAIASGQAVRPIGPVSTDGWYEHTDGTIGRYVWVDGYPRLRETVCGWASVPSETERIAAMVAADAASRG